VIKVADARAAAVACVAVLAAAAGVVAAWHWKPQVVIDHEALRKARLMEDVMFSRAAIGGPFLLTDHHGRRRGLEEFRGKVVVLYFGYTFCRDVCPTDLVSISKTIEALGPSGERVQPLFVTLDPERDTVEQLTLYVPHFHPRLIGLTGTSQEIGKVAELYKVYFKKAPAREEPNYFLDHSAYIYLLDEQGKYYGTFPPGTSPQRLTSVVWELLHTAPAAAR
jgi:cytochrome oxidase Cu insertion factor (SCO1/SenC/PrrC family)